MLMRLKQLHNRGDTIVEVMIVLAVLGLAIGIAYATANRSLQNTRQAQENSQATSLVQSQIEALRTMTDNPDILQAGPYCISPSYAVVTGSSCDFGRYHISITYEATTNTFAVKATWDDVQGQGVDTTSLSYRLYKAIPNRGRGSIVGGGGGGGGGLVSRAFTAVIGSKTCNAPGGPDSFGAGLYQANLYITGTAGETVTAHSAFSYGSTPLPGNDENIQIGTDGTATKSYSSSLYLSPGWTIVVTANGKPPITLDICQQPQNNFFNLDFGSD